MIPAGIAVMWRGSCTARKVELTGGPGWQREESGAQASALCGRAAHCGCQVGQGGSGSTRQAVGEASATRRVQAGLRHASRAVAGSAGPSGELGRAREGEGAWAGRCTGPGREKGER